MKRAWLHVHDKCQGEAKSDRDDLGPEAERSVLYPTWSVSPAAYPENELPLDMDNEISNTFISSLCFFKLSSFVPKHPCPFSF